MLYQFRYPRTRPWDAYVKAVQKVLKAKDETLIAEFDACQEHRSKVCLLCTQTFLMQLRTKPQAQEQQQFTTMTR